MLVFENIFQQFQTEHFRFFNIRTIPLQYTIAFDECRMILFFGDIACLQSLIQFVAVIDFHITLWREYNIQIFININQLRHLNPIKELTEQTVEELTDPMQLQYLVLRPEQYNLLAQHISVTGRAIVENTASILRLPTQDSIQTDVLNTIANAIKTAHKDSDTKLESAKTAIQTGSTEQTKQLKELLRTELRSMMSEVKARDQAPWKQKLRWISIGAALSSAVYALLLILL